MRKDAPLNRGEILDIAKELTYGPRNHAYDSPMPNHLRISKGWGVILGIEVEPWQVAACMVWLKLARAVASPEMADHWIDMAAYAGIAGELVNEETND